VQFAGRVLSPQIKYSFKEYSLGSGIDGKLHIPDLQPVERQAQRELQPQRQQLERQLVVCRRPQLSLD